MKEQYSSREIVVPVLKNFILVLFGITLALGMTEMLMRAFPNWIPTEIRVNPPVRRVKAFVDETYDLRLSDGDLYHYMRGEIMPLTPDRDRVIAHVHMITDAYGFRNSPPEQDVYDLITLGDSFTRASGVASPWPQLLAERNGINVLNLADVGFGPQDELKAFQRYGLKKQPEWVIMAYFEGNDLYDAASYEQANPFILLRFGRYLLHRSMEAQPEKSADESQQTTNPTYTYPIKLTINRTELEMAFFSSYISWLTLSKETMAASQNSHLVKDAIFRLQELCEEIGANFLLVYVPSKSHVYLPYLENAETEARIFASVPRLALDEDGFLQFSSEKATPELARQHMDDQAQLLAELAAEHKILFLDLTPAFQEAAGTGIELYYPFDTHWNQLGHDLAAKVIYDHILEVSLDSENRTAGQ